jgi:hypothetical protein
MPAGTTSRAAPSKARLTSQVRATRPTQTTARPTNSTTQGPQQQLLTRWFGPAHQSPELSSDSTSTSDHSTIDESSHHFTSDSHSSSDDSTNADPSHISTSHSHSTSEDHSSSIDDSSHLDYTTSDDDSSQLDYSSDDTSSQLHLPRHPLSVALATTP